MTAKNPQKTKTAYWGVTQFKDVRFKGTHAECWQWLVETFKYQTLQELVEAGYCISRIKLHRVNFNR